MTDSNSARRPDSWTDRDKQLLARRFASRLQDVKEEFVGRDDVIDLLALATICHEHVLLIGPPGTAKTRLINRFCRLLDTDPFTHLLTRFTEPAELFGPIDLQKFQAESVYHVNTAGMLPEAHIAFLDEVFQGSSAILNSLLTLVNERTFFTGGQTVRGRLITLLGSSNEVPDDPALAAFSDRFLFRCRVDYVPDEEIEDVLELGWAAERQQIRADPVSGGGPSRALAPVPVADPVSRSEVGFPLEYLTVLHRALADVDLGPVQDTFARIVRALRAEGVTFSDRRAVKAQKAFAASALLAGRLSAEPADLSVLAQLWADPRDEQSMHRVVTDHGVTVAVPGRTLRHSFELRADLRDHENRLRSLRTRDELRETVRRLGRLEAEAHRDHPAEQPLLASIARAQRDALTRLRELFPEE